MATTADYLNALKRDKTNLVTNLNAKGVSASDTETFTTLVPKVANIPAGGGGACVGKLQKADIKIPATGWTFNSRWGFWMLKIDISNDTSFWNKYEEYKNKAGGNYPLSKISPNIFVPNLNAEYISYNRLLQIGSLNEQTKMIDLVSNTKPPILEFAINLDCFFYSDENFHTKCLVAGQTDGACFKDLLWENPDITQPFDFSQRITLENKITLYNGIDVILSSRVGRDPSNLPVNDVCCSIKLSNYGISQEYIDTATMEFPVTFLWGVSGEKRLSHRRLWLHILKEGKTLARFDAGNDLGSTDVVSSSQYVPTAIYGW